MLRVLLLSCFVAFAYTKCGCKKPASEGIMLPKPDPVTGLYEGDMILTSANFQEWLGLRSAVKNIWPNRVLYYSVSSGDANSIAKALGALQKAVGNCVRFVKRTNQKDYVDVIDGAGCYSNVGKVGGRQVLSLKRGGCYNPSIIQHEFMHALGIWHEQNRPDRDKFVNVHWENIGSGACWLYGKMGSLPAGYPPYDIKSIMQYASEFFSCNGKSVLTNKSGGRISRSWHLSERDVSKIRALYKC